jgi:hypothetical protein
MSEQYKGWTIVDNTSVDLHSISIHSLLMCQSTDNTYDFPQRISVAIQSPLCHTQSRIQCQGIKNFRNWTLVHDWKE